MLKQNWKFSNVHPSDEQLLLAADGELSARRAARVQRHLAACWDCRARMAEIESTIADLARAHRRELDPQLPPIAGPRALLRAQIAKLASESEVSSRRWIAPFPVTAPVAVLVCLAFLLVLGVFLRHNHRRGAATTASTFEFGVVPNHKLTPGATRAVHISDVCSMTHEEVVADVSAPLRQEVLQQYGLVNARPGDYEIDYLIAPGLGGTEDIHNLWPESYRSSVWNARVKDALEERLHEMVCSGSLDLSTAQHDIATDWIAAYKKYFHTNQPLALRTGFDPIPAHKFPV